MSLPFRKAMEYQKGLGTTYLLAEEYEQYKSQLILENHEYGIYLYEAECLSLMDKIIEKHPQGVFDMIFADPPYFLSNDGFTCVAGKKASVNKGNWDKSFGVQQMHSFNKQWLARCQQLLKVNGTIWVSGTMHNIFSVGLAMQELDFKILNDITWEKPNPPPNLSCRYFTHATETLIWAAKNKKSKHFFDYQKMKEENGGKQMKSVWQIRPPAKNEKLHGKHPTQKPIGLLKRCIESSTEKGAFIFDPFSGSSTTGVAAALLERSFCGVEQEREFIELSICRLNEVML